MIRALVPATAFATLTFLGVADATFDPQAMVPPLPCDLVRDELYSLAVARAGDRGGH